MSTTSATFDPMSIATGSMNFAKTSMNFAMNNVKALAISGFVLVIAILILAQMVSYGYMYKNVQRYFRTTVNFTENANSLSHSRDPYKVIQKPFTIDSSTIFNLVAPGYYFTGANIHASIVSDGGGFVSVQKLSSTEVSLTPYRIIAPVHVTSVSHTGGHVTFQVPYGGQYYEVGDTFDGSGFTTASALNTTLTVSSSTPTSVTVTNSYSGATDTGTLTHTFPKPIVSGVMDVSVTFPMLVTQ